MAIRPAVLAEPEKRALLTAGRVQRWRAGSVLFAAGEPSDHVLLIRSGQVKVWSVSQRGGEAMLAIRGPDELVGEFSAIDGKPRSATVTALTRLEAVVISGDVFRRFLGTNAQVTFALLQRVLARVRESDRIRIDFGSYDVRERLARLLVELVAAYGVRADDGSSVELPLPLSQREFASATSASRETVARALREMRSHGVVTTSRKRIVVHDLQQLRAWADAEPS